MAGKKVKTRVVLQPLLHSYTVEAGENYGGSSLGNLLLRMMGTENQMVLTKKDIDYVRGLADGGMCHAHRLYEMLEKANTVQVTKVVEEVAE